MEEIVKLKDFKTSLENLILDNNRIMIAPHVNADCDALGSAIALFLIAKKLGKEAYIVMNDLPSQIDNTVRKIKSELPTFVNIIDLNKANSLIDDQTILICTDTNKTNLIPFTDLNKFNEIAIIDHHATDDKTIATRYKYITTTASSACEIVYRLLNQFSIRIEACKEDKQNIPNLANILLSGIVLDTNKLTKNVSSITMDVAAKLMKRGAQMDYINNLFQDDFDSVMRVQNLVSNTGWFMYNMAICMNNENPDTIYQKEDLAKASDDLLKFKADASFVLGYIATNVVSISARSKGTIDVGTIMSHMGGGGNMYSGAAKIDNADVHQVKAELSKILTPGYGLKTK